MRRTSANQFGAIADENVHALDPFAHMRASSVVRGFRKLAEQADRLSISAALCPAIFISMSHRSVSATK